MKENRKPNFILFITDQQRADFLGCYGHPVLQTPHIDRMAAQGICFDRCYAAAPICMPNRASLVTGRMPSQHLARSNGVPLAMSDTTMMDLLSEAGYHTGLIGKCHLQNHLDNPPILQRPRPRPGFHTPSESLSQAKSDHRDGPAYEQETPAYWSRPEAALQLPYYGFQHAEITVGHSDMAGGEYLRWVMKKGVDITALRGRENALPHQTICPQAWRTAIPEALYPTSFIAERAQAFIERQGPDQPFFLMVSFPDPHHPITPAGHYWDMYRAEDMPVPEAYRQAGWNPPPHVHRLLEDRRTGQANVHGFIGFSITQEEALAAQALTCGLIAHIDDAVGRVVNTLENAGLARDTVLIYTCDHGDYLGDHRLFLKGPAHYQSLIRTPFIWADPDSPLRNQRSQALCSTIDLSAAILDRARIEPSIGFMGQNPIAAVQGAVSPRDAVVVEEEQQRLCYGFNHPPRVQTLVTDRWRLTMYRGVSWGELYDLYNDPEELVNRWADPACLGTKAELLERLARWNLDHVDPSPFPTKQS